MPRKKTVEQTNSVADTVQNKQEETPKKRLKVLIVTPEITYVPTEMGHVNFNCSAKAGGLADVSASLVAALYRMGADVHVAMPHYRRLFHKEFQALQDARLKEYDGLKEYSWMSHGLVQVHLAEDRTFYYLNSVYSKNQEESLRMSLTFQREVINNIIPAVQPDLIHCNDWMTGLIPAYARRLGIPTLFTVHNIHTMKTTLEQIENAGIDTGVFWPNLYFDRQPWNYEETRSSNPVDLLTSGIFASHFINTVSPTFLEEIVLGVHSFVPPQIQSQMAFKAHAGCATGILNAPDPEYNPATDTNISFKYTTRNFRRMKNENKAAFQEAMGLPVNPDAPILFWPSRLDPIQKGPELLTDILYQIMHEYWDLNLQLAVVADGPFQQHIIDIMRFHGLEDRIAVHRFDEQVSHMGYAASDFVLMPSRFEPCGLPQMIGPLYGSLPIVHDTGGLHDTVTHFDPVTGTGNGFVFKYYDSQGLKWAIDEALKFYQMPIKVRDAQIARIMKEAAATFNHEVTAQKYIELYGQMLDRPLLDTEKGASESFHTDDKPSE